MQIAIKSERLFITPLASDDFEFIKVLVNTPGWIKFIGDRNIHSKEAAQQYIQKILDKEHTHYWIVRLKDHGVAIGIITLMLRNYLNDYDFGFAFLPEYGKQGFAFEAAAAVLNELEINSEYKQLLAITMQQNVSSIKLLEKLGFVFEKNMVIDNEELKMFKRG
ncbi:MAG: GNAT family N-acetyltransferase [Bacteroidetes bacterium]|nr:GNAT family N-acetyltransferase [Bacteroidota bacterium]